MVGFSLDAFRLNHLLGLPPLLPLERCWGFGACCNCGDCLQREYDLEHPEEAAERRKPAAQPWELAA